MSPPSSSAAASSAPAALPLAATSSPATLPLPLGFQHSSPSTIRRQAPPSLALAPPAAAPAQDLFGGRPPLARPLSARLASEDDHPALLVVGSPSTPTFRPGSSRRPSDGMPTTTRQLYASAVPGKQPTSPPASSASPAIPRAFVRQKLRQLAGAFYQRTDNADVTIRAAPLPRRPLAARSVCPSVVRD